MEPTPVFLSGEFRGQRRLAGYGAWSRKELDTTERLTFSLSTILCIHLLCLLMWGIDYKTIHPLCTHGLQIRFYSNFHQEGSLLPHHLNNIYMTS